MYALARSTILDTVLGLHTLLQHQGFIEGGNRGALAPPGNCIENIGHNALCYGLLHTNQTKSVL